MGGFFGKEELENLKSLKRDLVDPVKAFADEVRSDTLGDAGRFYKARARRAKRGAEQARERTREKMAAIRREQEEMKKRRGAMMKRAALTLALLALLSLILISAALSAHAAGLRDGREEDRAFRENLTCTTTTAPRIMRAPCRPVSSRTGNGGDGAAPCADKNESVCCAFLAPVV